jgi:hypothetical protein
MQRRSPLALIDARCMGRDHCYILTDSVNGGIIIERFLVGSGWDWVRLEEALSSMNSFYLVVGLGLMTMVIHLIHKSNRTYAGIVEVITVSLHCRVNVFRIRGDPAPPECTRLVPALEVAKCKEHQFSSCFARTCK